MTDQIAPMTLDEIDQVLPTLRKKWEASIANLMDLSGMTTYQRLTGEGGWPKVVLTGKTLAVADGVLEAFTELFLHGDALREKIEEAEKLRKDMPRLNRGDQIDKISFILKGASIKLPSVQVPLEQRGLLSTAEIQQAVTIDRLLEAMGKAFTDANQLVHDVDEAWTTLKGRLSGASTEVTELSDLAATLQETSCTQLIAARAKLQQVQGQVDSDPLGVTQGFEQEIEPLIKPARELLRGLAAQKDKVYADAKLAPSLLDELKTAQEQGKKVFAERAEKVTVTDADQLPAPLEDSVIDKLSQWLATLEGLLAKQGWRQVRVGLDNWNIQAEARLTHARSVISSNNLPLAKRRELRGLLDSLKAMAASRGLAEDPAASAIYTKAHGLLYTRPTPLAEAEKLVYEYQAAIR